MVLYVYHNCVNISVGPNPVTVTASVDHDRYYSTFYIRLSWRVRLIMHMCYGTVTMCCNIYMYDRNQELPLHVLERSQSI